jgi:DNA-binding CsgD family transcriptional regulator
MLADVTLSRTTGDIVEIAASAVSAAELEHALLSRLRRDVPFDIGFFLRRGGIGPSQQGLVARLTARMRERVGVYGAELAPVFARARQERGVAIDRDVLGRVLERTRVYREFVAPHGGYSTALVLLSLAGQPVATLALGRCDRMQFSSRDVDALAALVPALSLCELAVRNAGRTRAHGLTLREAEILDYLERGFTNPEIALACGKSTHTVRNQLRSLFKKLGASTRAEAVAISLGRLQ